MVVRHHLTMQRIPFSCSTAGVRIYPEVLQHVVTLVHIVCNKLCAAVAQSTAMLFCDRFGSVKFEHSPNAFSNIQVASSKLQMEFTRNSKWNLPLAFFFSCFPPSRTDVCMLAQGSTKKGAAETTNSHP